MRPAFRPVGPPVEGDLDRLRAFSPTRRREIPAAGGVAPFIRWDSAPFRRDVSSYLAPSAQVKAPGGDITHRCCIALTSVGGCRRLAVVSAEEIDAYLAALDEPKRSTLEAQRRSILHVVPDAEQCLS